MWFKLISLTTRLVYIYYIILSVELILLLVYIAFSLCCFSYMGRETLYCGDLFIRDALCLPRNAMI